MLSYIRYAIGEFDVLFMGGLMYIIKRNLVWIELAVYILLIEWCEQHSG
jgi:hypothetical protein